MLFVNNKAAPMGLPSSNMRETVSLHVVQHDMKFHGKVPVEGVLRLCRAFTLVSLGGSKVDILVFHRALRLRCHRCRRSGAQRTMMVLWLWSATIGKQSVSILFC